MPDLKRDEIVSTFRSTVFTNNTEGTSEIEVFQNDVLRPILKFQHPSLIALFTNELILQKQLKKTTTLEEYTSVIQDFISKDAKFRQLLIGVVIGLFNQVELEFYFKEKKESNKRIITMIVKRFTDTTYK
jgi:hypothetical protein